MTETNDRDPNRMIPARQASQDMQELRLASERRWRDPNRMIPAWQASQDMQELRRQHDAEHQELEALKKLMPDKKLAKLKIAKTNMDIAERAQHIALELQTGGMQPEAAKTALYALQVAMSAIRTKDNAIAARQKEERLRSPKTPTPSTPKANRNPSSGRSTSRPPATSTSTHNLRKPSRPAHKPNRK